MFCFALFSALLRSSLVTRAYAATTSSVMNAQLARDRDYSLQVLNMDHFTQIHLFTSERFY